jgi:MOSC domain-containing protein YiiM
MSDLRLLDREPERTGVVVGVFAKQTHGFSKDKQSSIRLIPGIGIEGDAHAGSRVKHLWSKKRQPRQPNLRQIHLIATELLDELKTSGFDVQPGDLGENISTRNVDLTALPQSTLLRIGNEAVISLTGLREPCVKIDRFQRGLRKLVSVEAGQGKTLKHGVMGVVVAGGIVRAGDLVRASLPALPHQQLGAV